MSDRDTHDYRRAAWMPSTSRQETYDRLCELVRSGCRTRRQIADALGAGFHALRCYMWRHGITMDELVAQVYVPPPDPVHAERLARVKELHGQGFAIRQIAKMLGVSNQRGADLCREAGCVMRKPGAHNHPIGAAIGGRPIGEIPPGHPLYEVDDAAMRARDELAAAEARRALRRAAA